MGQRFVIEDDVHAEWVARFVSREEAVAFADRLRSDPAAVENKPPCTNWRRCRRDYYLLEYDDATTPWTLSGRQPLFAIDFSNGTVSSVPPG
jgi:hypothetical protein